MNRLQLDHRGPCKILPSFWSVLLFPQTKPCFIITQHPLASFYFVLFFTLSSFSFFFYLFPLFFLFLFLIFFFLSEMPALLNGDVFYSICIIKPNRGCATKTHGKLLNNSNINGIGFIFRLLITFIQTQWKKSWTKSLEWNGHK